MTKIEPFRKEYVNSAWKTEAEDSVEIKEKCEKCKNNLIVRRNIDTPIRMFLYVAKCLPCKRDIYFNEYERFKDGCQDDET